MGGPEWAMAWSWTILAGGQGGSRAGATRDLVRDNDNYRCHLLRAS